MRYLVKMITTFRALGVYIHVLAKVLLSYPAQTNFAITSNPTWLVQPEMVQDRMLTIEIVS